MYLQKQVEISDDIVAQIEHVTQTSVDRDNIVVFEAAVASTRPLTKVGSIFHGARMSRQLLQDMAAAVNSGDESVPLHTLHLQGDELPVGRVFQAWVQEVPDGSADLHAYFYLPLTETSIIEKINLSVLDEVSVGMKPDQALCSKCGFDYFGQDADFIHLFSQTCENDHTIGVDGTHLKLTGLDYWSELSLVSRGASSKPKILSRARQSVSQEAIDRMAASGTPVEAAHLVVSLSEMEAPVPKEIKAETETENEAENAAAAQAAEENSEELSAKAGEENEQEEVELSVPEQIDALQAQLDALKASMTEEEPEPTIEDLQEQLAAANARIAELEASAEEEVEEEVDTEAELDLPAGGVSRSAIADAKRDGTPSLRASAFKTNKHRK